MPSSAELSATQPFRTMPHVTPIKDIFDFGAPFRLKDIVIIQGLKKNKHNTRNSLCITNYKLHPEMNDSHVYLQV